MVGRGKGSKVLAVALKGGDALQRIPYRITIEGSHWAPNPHDLKAMIRDAIVDAANEVPGAESLFIGTRHADAKERRNGMPKVTAPGSGSPAGRRPKAGVKIGSGPGSGNRTEGPHRTAIALLAAKKRFGWTQAKYLRRLQEEGVYDLAEEMGHLANGTAPRKRVRNRHGLTISEVLPNGTKIYSDGSRITPSGRRFSPESVKALQENAAAARSHKRAIEVVEDEETAESFSPPPGDTQVSPQEEQGPALVEEAAPEVNREQEQPRPFEEMPRRGGGVIRRVLGWHSDDPPRVVDLPPQTTEEWWDNVVLAYQRPDTDPEALCHNNHITREQLDHELGRRGIRAYSHHPTDSKATLPPPRLR